MSQKKKPAGRPRIPELWDPEWLRREHIEKRQTSGDIAEKLGCSPNTVKAALRRYNPRRSKTPRFVVPAALAKALELEVNAQWHRKK